MSSCDTRVIKLNDCVSDGSSSRWPNDNEGYTRCDDHYKAHLAKQWLRDQGEFAGNAMLDRLPAGYAGFEKPRPFGSKIRSDKYVYGHPNGRFDSTTKFSDHAKHLTTHGSAHGCTCILCDPRAYAARVPSKRATKSSFKHEDLPDPIIGKDDHHQLFDSHTTAKGVQPKPHPHGGFDPSDDQSSKETPILSKLAMKVASLAEDQSLNHSIESASTEWPFIDANRNGLQVSENKSPALPRLGEVILYITTQDKSTYDSDIDPLLCFCNAVEMCRAGVVVSTAGTGPLTSEVPHNAQVVVRELFSGSLGPAEMIYCRNARKVSDVHRIVKNPSTSNLEQSVLQALHLPPSVMMFRPYWLKSTVAQGSRAADIIVEGVYLRHELIAVGDLVAIRSARELHDDEVLLWITKIKLHLTNVTAQGCNATIHVIGVPLTTEPSVSSGGYARSPATKFDHLIGQQLGMKLTFYHVIEHSEHQRVQVPLNSVSNRLDRDFFEHGHSQSATGSDPKSGLVLADGRMQQLQLQ